MESSCPELLRLGEVLIGALGRQSRAQAAHLNPQTQEPTRLTVLALELHSAKHAVRTAREALHKHVKEHGCYSARLQGELTTQS